MFYRWNVFLLQEKFKADFIERLNQFKKSDSFYMENCKIQCMGQLTLNFRSMHMTSSRLILLEDLLSSVLCMELRIWKLQFTSCHIFGAVFTSWFYKIAGFILLEDLQRLVLHANYLQRCFCIDNCNVTFMVDMSWRTADLHAST